MSALFLLCDTLKTMGIVILCIGFLPIHADNDVSWYAIIGGILLMFLAGFTELKLKEKCKKEAK